jgi:hypothetical protein
MGVTLPEHMESRTPGDQKKWAHVAGAVEAAFEDLGAERAGRLAMAAANTALSEKRANGPAFKGLNARLDNLARCRKDRTMKDAADIVAADQVMRHLLVGFCDVQDEFVGMFPFDFESGGTVAAKHKRASEIDLAFGDSGGPFPWSLGKLGRKSAAVIDHVRAKAGDAWDIYDTLTAVTLRMFAETLEHSAKMSVDARKSIGSFDLYPELTVFLPFLDGESGVRKAVEEAESWVTDLQALCARIEDVVFPLYEDVAQDEVGDAPVDETEDEFQSVKMKVLKDGDVRKRVILGVALVPDEVDLQDDLISAPEIERAAHQFMLNKGQIGIMHQEFPSGATAVVESYLAPHDMILGNDTISKGSWVIGVKVFDDDLLKRIEEGEFTGFSIGGHAASARELG